MFFFLLPKVEEENEKLYILQSCEIINVIYEYNEDADEENRNIICHLNKSKAA